MSDKAREFIVDCSVGVLIGALLGYCLGAETGKELYQKMYSVALLGLVTGGFVGIICDALWKDARETWRLGSVIEGSFCGFFTGCITAYIWFYWHIEPRIRFDSVIDTLPVGVCGVIVSLFVRGALDRFDLTGMGLGPPITKKKD